MFFVRPSTSVVPPELSTVWSKCAETVTYDFSSVVTKCGVHRVPCHIVTCIITCVLKCAQTVTYDIRHNYMCVKSQHIKAVQNVI